VPPKQYDHPCPFPEEIPFRLIRLYSFRGDKVLDPFAGIGTTLKVAKHLGRDYYGYEIVKKYHDAALERLDTPLKLRDQLISRFEKTGEKEF
jgi:site-specific DNA-methyltransferase (adenine-specific)